MLQYKVKILHCEYPIYIEHLLILESLLNVLTTKVNIISAISLKRQFEISFIDKDRWQLYLEGLGNTLIVTFFALILGIVIGAVVAIVRASYDKNYSEMKGGLGKILLAIFNIISKIYLTVVRGTPVVIQIMIMYYIIFATSNNKIFVAILSFGINSGAYVAEIFRGGIMSIDEGQFEAGRSLGFNYVQTMVYVIIPQAFKTVLPTLGNEFIVLLKETAVSGYVALIDLTRAGDIVRGATYQAFMPLFGVAAVYLIMVMFFSWLLGKLERRLRNDER